MTYASIRESIDRMFPAMPEVKSVANDQCSFTNIDDSIDRDIADLEVLLEKRNLRIRIEKAEEKVKFYLARAKEAEDLKRTDLQKSFLYAAENWGLVVAGLQDELRSLS
jgi:hypothetical protein